MEATRRQGRPALRVGKTRAQRPEGRGRPSYLGGLGGRLWRNLGPTGALLCVSSKPALSAQRSGDAGDGAQPALYLSSISIQLPTVKETEAQYSGSSRTSLPSLVHQS